MKVNVHQNQKYEVLFLTQPILFCFDSRFRKFILFFVSSNRVIFGLLCLITICSARPADEEYADYEEAAPAPSPKPVAPARHSPLLNRRNPLTARAASAKTTTTTTTAAPPQVYSFMYSESLNGDTINDITEFCIRKNKMIKPHKYLSPKLHPLRSFSHHCNFPKNFEKK